MQTHTHSSGKGWEDKSGVWTAEFKSGTSKHLAFGPQTYKHTHTLMLKIDPDNSYCHQIKYKFIYYQICSPGYSNLSFSPLWT